MMKFIAGIDGGGTKTKVIIASPEGEFLQTQVFGPFNLNSIGAKQFSLLLDEICTWLNQQGECLALCIGSAGVSNQEMNHLVVEGMQRGGISNWKLVGDQVIALTGALEGKPGIALIAGTGSICFGKNASGQFARSGGWGHLIGDEGSGYALGRDALSAVARAWDGWGEKTLLSELLASELGLDDQKKIISYTYGGDKSRIAALSHLVEKAAAKADHVALGIICANAVQMTRLVGAVAQKLNLESPEVAMLGGLLENETMLRAQFQAEMAKQFPQMRCIAPYRDAAAGAVMLAKEIL